MFQTVAGGISRGLAVLIQLAVTAGGHYRACWNVLASDVRPAGTTAGMVAGCGWN